MSQRRVEQVTFLKLELELVCSIDGRMGAQGATAETAVVTLQRKLVVLMTSSGAGSMALLLWHIMKCSNDYVT
jgi:hypothetical protein